jgi:hypothetical protein
VGAGHRSVGKELYRAAADGIRHGTIEYADSAGGVGEGSTNDQNATEHALAYLARLAKKSRINSWPGPLALYVLAERSFEDVLSGYFGIGDLPGITEKAKSDILKRRQLAQALLVLGTMYRVRGDGAGCHKMMQYCAQLENPHLENPHLENPHLEDAWYLAAAEVGLFPPR